MKSLASLEVEILSTLAVSACGAADVPTLIHLIGEEHAGLVKDVLAALLAVGEVEEFGVAYRITDSGRARLNGRTSS